LGWVSEHEIMKTVEDWKEESNFVVERILGGGQI
jgi:hypothetical protein